MPKLPLSEPVSPIAALPPGSIVSLVGGGGKTSALFSLARRQDHPVIVTTTTKVGVNQIQAADIRLTPEAFLRDPERAVQRHVVWVSDLNGEPGGQKVSGLRLPDAEKIAAAVKNCGYSMIVEADGAHCSAIKAPADHEPVVPPQTDLVVACIGLSVLDRPADDSTVHRLPLFLKCTNAEPGAPIGADTILKLVRHPRGAFKGVPPGAEKILLLNQADNGPLVDRARSIGTEALTTGVDRVWITCLKRGAWIAELRNDTK